jgi:hypothetical protein
MHTFTEKPKATQQTMAANHHLPRTIRNQPVPWIVQSKADELEAALAGTAPPRFTHDFSQIPLHTKLAAGAQAMLSINSPGDIYEKEADRVSEQVMRIHESQRPHDCAGDGACPTFGPERHDQDGPPQQVSRMKANAPEPSVPASPATDVLHRPGQPLDAATRAFMEFRFGHDFSHVRIHADNEAERSAAALQARAYTVGNRIVFGTGQYAPATASGRRLIAHELTHVLQQGPTPRAMRQRQSEATSPEKDDDELRSQGMEVGGMPNSDPVQVRQHGGVRVSRDLAIEPTRPNAAEPVLTVEQIQEAIRYNAFRFKDPYSIAIVRDIVGVPRFPAVSDEDLALGVARYQAAFGLTPDGKAGPQTTRRLVAEAGAESLPADAEQLRADNYVTWTPAAGVHNGCGAAVDAAGLATFFQWDVNFSTSLRNGWIVQEIVNRRARTTCAGGPIAETLTPHYWEAWWVDGAGNVRIPTAINAARTRATTSVAPAPAHDLWRRASAAPSRGDWSMNALLFTCLRLPAGFAAGNVADALALPSTAAAPNSDDLGLVVAARRAGGTWNCCGAPATHFHHP